ncbi:MAG TPA: PRC-barrel domain-containing protein [Alphaproteobacteria bacterium]|nr:PRC-barrel domain-containing protein [Alphaproteobacteria bacterium]
MLKVVEVTIVALVLTATAFATVMMAPAWSQGVPQTMGLVKVDPTSVATGYRASKIVGAEVYNAANESVGKVDDVIVSNDGKIPYVVLAVGGFLGMGQRLVVVGSSALAIRDGKIIIADASRDQLKALPEFRYAD